MMNRVNFRVNNKEFFKMHKDHRKRFLINQLANELGNQIKYEDFAIEKEDQFNSVLMYLEYDFKILNKPENNIPPAFFTMNDLIEYSQGNMGALKVLEEIYGDAELQGYIKYHELKGEYIYVLWNDCCNRCFSRFKKVIKSDYDLIKSICDDYDETGRGKDIDPYDDRFGKL